MTGARDAYSTLPFFYSDLFGLGYEAVGLLDARLQTVEDWSEPQRKGVVYYLDAGRVRGVLLWNVWNQVDAARAHSARRVSVGSFFFRYESRRVGFRPPSDTASGGGLKPTLRGVTPPGRPLP